MNTCQNNHEWDASARRICPICIKEKRHAYYLKNRERELENAKKWQAENRKELLEYKKKYNSENKQKAHGWYKNRLRKRPLDSIWRVMIARCNDPKHHKYPDYGGRGIKVCDRWLGENGYRNFEADMGPRPSPLHSIDRRNNDGHYEPNNVSWGTKKHQQRNRRVNSLATISGRTQCVSAWAEEIGIRRSTFQRRLDLGWSGSKLLRPADQKFNRLAKIPMA